MDSSDTINRGSFTRMHWALPIVLAIVLLPVLIFLPWQNQKNEFQDRQEQLIADTLWVEQGIRSQLARDEDYIRYIANAISGDLADLSQIKKNFFALQQNHPEFENLIWLDPKDHLLYSSHVVSFGQFSKASHDILLDARASRAGQYGQPEVSTQDSNNFVTNYYLPVFQDKQYLGCMVVSYQLSSLLDRVVPWWFAKDNQISIIDTDDRVLAQRADRGPGLGVFTHTKALDVPGLNLSLHTNSIRGNPRLLSNFLVMAVMVLGVSLSWSLWALWRDILRRQAAETALRNQIAFRKAMENSLITGIRVRSLDGRLVYVNPAFCEMVGFPAEQLIGKKIPFPFWTEEAHACFVEHAPHMSSSKSLYGIETVYQHSSGRRIPVLIYESALLDEFGNQAGWMGSILDISERKRTEQMLRQHEDKIQTSARLATMGELASVMAHELNQPLTAISTYASGALNMMQKNQIDLSQLQMPLQQMQTQSMRAAKIIRSVHDFVIKREPTRVRMTAAGLFRDVLPLLELQAKSYMVALKINIQTDLPDVAVDAISIEQVILNLTRNALQAMQNFDRAEREIQIGAFRYGSALEVEITDNGPGIPEEVAARLFSPFFSTKAEGMGMGLNICRTIIEFHGGQLNFRPNPKGGTIFSFTLPAVSELNESGQD